MFSLALSGTSRTSPTVRPISVMVVCAAASERLVTAGMTRSYWLWQMMMVMVVPGRTNVPGAMSWSATRFSGTRGISSKRRYGCRPACSASCAATCQSLPMKLGTSTVFCRASSTRLVTVYPSSAMTTRSPSENKPTSARRIHRTRLRVRSWRLRAARASRSRRSSCARAARMVSGCSSARRTSRSMSAAEAYRLRGFFSSAWSTT